MSPPRIALVTGANRGLGLGTAHALAAQGYHVLVAARDAARAAEAAAAVQAAGGSAEALELDVASDASVEAAFAALRARHGRLDVLVNNAGAIFEANLHVNPLQIPAEVLATAFQTNTLGAWRTMAQALPMMNAAGYGRVVNVSSGMGGLTEMGSGWPAYRLSKAAMNAATRVAAGEALPHVKVNSVCPGWVRTDMGGPDAPRGLDQGVASILWAATLPDDGPSGGFFRDGVAIAW